MTNKDLDLAREWADDSSYQGDALSVATARVIQALPDRWIDAEKVRELLDKWAANPFPTSDEVAVLNDVESLITPPLPTLHHLVRELEKDPEDYRWMQAKAFHTGELGCITDFDLYREIATVIFPNGVMKNVTWEDTTPLPDLPKLEWPGSTPDDVAYATGGALTTQDVVDECRAVRKERATMEPTLPRPEDVPAGEPWIVQYEGLEWVGLRAAFEPFSPWLIARMDGLDSRDADDIEITLVSRLVPEVAP